MSATPFAVAIPARDEEVLLPRLLESLVVQTSGWADGHIFLVANNCTDGTAEVARRFAPRLPIAVIDTVYPAKNAHVGTARKAALDAACEWLDARHPNGVLLTTDADAHVPNDWLSNNLRALERCDIAGGRLVVDHDAIDVSPLQDSIDAYWAGVRAIDATIDPLSHDPPPRHGDHTGASLAFRTSLYRRLGGLTPLPSREDVDFVDRAVRAGARLAHPPDINVRVSARTAGRADGGMAAEMLRRQSLQERADIYLLPHPRDWIDRSLSRRRLRLAWCERTDLTAALAVEGICGAHSSTILTDCPNDIAFVERASAALSHPSRAPMAVDAAVACMRAYLGTSDSARAVA